MLTLLAVLALPMQTAAHKSNGEEDVSYPLNLAHGHDSSEHRGAAPHTPLSNIIQWIRIYKNPEMVPKSQLKPAGTNYGYPLFTFEEFPATKDGSALTTYLYPSSYGPDYGPTAAQNPDIEWVKFHPADHPDDPGGLIDKGDNSGLVTATENTSVKVGDIVAIAIRVKDLGAKALPHIAIGPLGQKAYTTGNRTIPRPERKWRLAANLPIWPINRAGSQIEPRAGYEHTLVYHFVVTADHADDLNADGPWIKYGFDPYVPYRATGGARAWENEPYHGNDQWPYNANDPYDPPRENPRQDYAKLDPPGNIVVQTIGADTRRVAVAFEWLYDDLPVKEARDSGRRLLGVFGHPDPTSRPSPTSLKPFNTFTFNSIALNDWGVDAGHVGGFPVRGWAYHLINNTQDRNVANKRSELNFYTHYHVPRYDTADKPHIFYPKLERPDTPATTAIEVPGGTQTGEFTVTLRFSDNGAFEGHHLSDEKVAAFKDKLTTALAAGEHPWTVTALTYAGGIVTAASNPSSRSLGGETRYTLTLSPPLGVKGAVELQIPANTVMDIAGSGNLAASVMVSVDTVAALSVVTPPEVVLGTGEVTVWVPFAQDGMTYEGDAPPYLTIYLGDEVAANARHAVWQKGSESSGSTRVPFVYKGNDVGALVTAKMETLAIPEGTTLVSGSVRQAGKAPVASGPKEVAPPPDDTLLSVTDSQGAALPPAQFIPYLPPTEESEPKAGMSSVPRSPIVFNELGNGSGDTNDWLELRNVTGDAVSLKEWELSVVQDGKKEDTSLIVFPDVSVPAEGLLLLTNSDPTADGNLLAGGDDIATAKAEVKGSSHLYLVNAGLSLPDDGQFLLILRNAKEKRGLNEAFVDVAGGGGSGTDAFVREQEGDYDTYVWPLQVLEAPGDATEDALSSGKVWLRAKADIVGYHRDAWAEAAFTGVGYDRKVSKSAETAGTPGYPNGAVKTEAPTPRGAITISEVMFDAAGGTLPQWIELYNASKTDALNLNRWELEIQNVDSEELVGRPIVRLTLQEKVIQPNQTLLIVTGNARASSADVYPADRVYNLLELHDKNLRIKKPSDTFLSAKGFYLRLTDRNEHLVDEVGNTDGNRRTDDTPAWALPMPLSEVEGMRSSLVRRYDKGVARDGKEKSSWALAANFAKFKAAELHYGHADDIGTPGYRQGGALPVELSNFTVTRLESGSVIVTWTTESEVDNAGFNLRRSLTRDSGFKLLNPALIAGAGTTGERQTYTYIDTSAKPGVEHYYQIEEVSFGGKAETLVTRRLRGPVSPAHRALKTLGEVKQAK